MKRLLMFTFIALFALGSMAFATEVRVLTMGDANNIVKDEANIWLYPSTINFYPDVFYGEFGNDWDYYYGYGSYGTANYYEKAYDMDYIYGKAGVHLKFGEDREYPIIFGAYFSNHRYYNYVLDDYGSYYDKDVYYGTAGHQIDLFLGWYLSEMPFGFHIGYYNESDKIESSDYPGEEYEDGVSRYEFGFGGSLMEEKLEFGVGIAFDSWTDKDYWDSELGLVDLTKPDGNMEFYLTARYFTDPIGRMVLIPHAGFLSKKEGIEVFNESGGDWVSDGKVAYKDLAFDFGCGTNYEAGDGILVITDLGFQYYSWKVEYDGEDYYKYSWTALPYFRIGLDAKVFDWLALRTGAKTGWYADKDTYEGENWEQSWKYSYTDFYLGLGFTWNNLTLDCTLDSEFLEQGPYFISGDNEVDEMFQRISLKYNF